MRNAFAVFLFCGMTLLSGCALADTFAGIERDGEGKVVKVSGGIAETGITLLNAVLGGSAASVGTAALMYYRHKRIIASGGKDDNINGIPDEQEKKA